MAAMGRHTVDLPCLVLARLVASSSSWFPVCCAHCLLDSHTHIHTQTHSTSDAHRGLANPVTSGHIGWVEAFSRNCLPPQPPPPFTSTLHHHSFTDWHSHSLSLSALCSFLQGDELQNTAREWWNRTADKSGCTVLLVSVLLVYFLKLEIINNNNFYVIKWRILCFIYINSLLYNVRKPLRDYLNYDGYYNKLTCTSFAMMARHHNVFIKYTGVILYFHACSVS